MPLQRDGLTPREFWPACIKVRPGGGAVLNAVNLSGPGLPFLLGLGRWQKLENPFFLSFMSVGETKEDRMDELKKAVELLKNELPNFKSKIGLQINFSCPNTGHDQEMLAGEVHEALAIASELGVPLVPKISVVLSPGVAADIMADPNCDAIAVSNAVPWKDVAPDVREAFFHTTVSPLESFGSGAVSGKYLLPLVIEWIRQFRHQHEGIAKPIIAGGGILRASDVDKIVEIGATAISPGTITILRPWNLKKVIARANELLTK
jgi:dihydroorotate dehydrogenase